MLFSSQVFILLFLPVVVTAYYAVADRRSPRLALLLVSSLIFYGWWDIRFVPLLPVTIVVNWLAAHAFAAFGRRSIIIGGVTFNLALIGFFKYTNFFAESALTFAGVEFQPLNIILPLGISFFTFQQISYLVDLKRDEAPTYGLLEYACFVCFFPQLIAGPIVRHNELIPQFGAHPIRTDAVERIARGLVLFILGLVKKVFFADELAPIADAGFALAGAATVPGAEAAWQGALAYSLQLYFDFSAYSDMAMGLGALFGFDLPLNFDSPYRATSIREFWRRWHMTLTRFLRDYVYIPLGGSRQSAARTYVVALFTMLLCGLWHGAGWTFIAWGGLHGVAVCCNRIWMGTDWHLPPFAGWAITMLFVVVGWVLFRAKDFGVASELITAMFGGGGDAVPDQDGWIMVLVGLVFALVGPTNVEWTRARWLARRLVAVPVAFFMVATIMRVGQGRGLEFIYFQF